MAYAARAAGARLAVQSAFRSYATQKATFDYWVRVHGYATAIRRAPAPATASTSSGPRSTSELRRHGALGLQRLGDDQGRVPG